MAFLDLVYSHYVYLFKNLKINIVPYRRLPNNEQARLRALKTALEKGANLPPFELPYSQNSLKRLRGFFPEYERLFKQLEETRSNLSAKNKKYVELQKKARLYLSHFIQVMNLSIQRGELKPEARKFYGIKENTNALPKLNTEQELLKWGEKIINGEPERIANGGNPVTNPTVAVVKVRYDQFLDSYKYQNSLRETYKRLLSSIVRMREEADSIILAIWNEVESFYSKLPENERIEKCKVFGVVYFLRSSEKNKINKSNEIGENDSDSEKDDIVIKRPRKKDRNDSQISLLLFQNEAY